jgi:hypothetical protein
MQKRKMQIMPDFKGQRGLFATKYEHFASKTAVFFISGHFDLTKGAIAEVSGGFLKLTVKAAGHRRFKRLRSRAEYGH